ncbi:hypothetical protein K9M48_02685 [Candidatus Gracilibacteria bacterium]|nr:hypothetical protein [Candidatus Gracilibacteria bacterium]
MKLSSNDKLKGYAFDVDSNLIFTNTKILLEKFDGEKWNLIEVSQEEYPELIKLAEYRFLDGDREKSMQNFVAHGTFQNEFIDALDNNRFGPSWDKFKQATMTAKPSSIITARGHPMQEIKDTHKFLIFEVLEQSELDQLIHWMGVNTNHRSRNKNKVVNNYLDNNLYLPVRSNDFDKMFNVDKNLSTRERKLVGFEAFLNHLYKVFEKYTSNIYLENKKISIGFSDDFYENVDGMRNFIESVLLKKYPNFRFSVYDTSNPKFVKKITLERDN